MRDRNFLAELLRSPSGATAQPQGNPMAQAMLAQPTQELTSQPLATQQKFTPISVLDSRQALANSLLQQASDRSVHPLARGLAAYFGSKASKDIDRERTKTEESIAAQKAEAEQRKIDMENKLFGLKEREVGIGEERLDAESKRADREFLLKEKDLEQRAKQFDQTLNLNREQFNAKQQRDADNNAVTKIRDEGKQVDLLFKGNAPVTDGLEKGLQWGVDDDGNRVAVPIPTQPDEKAAAQKELALETVNRLLNNEDGVKGNFGALDKFLPNTRESTMQAETDLNQLRSLLTVENLGLMSGVLSETDIKIIQNVAGGGIADTASEKGALEALRRLKKALSGKVQPKDEGGGTPNVNDLINKYSQ